jgi:hypothetical protein
VGIFERFCLFNNLYKIMITSFLRRFWFGFGFNSTFFNKYVQLIYRKVMIVGSFRRFWFCFVLGLHFNCAYSRKLMIMGSFKIFWFGFDFKVH